MPHKMEERESARFLSLSLVGPNVKKNWVKIVHKNFQTAIDPKYVDHLKKTKTQTFSVFDLRPKNRLED